MSIALPDHVAADHKQQKQQQQQAAMRQAAIGDLRIKIAADIYARIVPDQFQLAVNNAVDEADPFGTGHLTDDDPDEPKEIPFAVNLHTPAKLAWDAATIFLSVGKLLSPEERDGLLGINAAGKKEENGDNEKPGV